MIYMNIIFIINLKFSLFTYNYIYLDCVIMGNLFSSNRKTKTVYIGAGMDFNPLLNTSNNSTLFVFIDCQPFNTPDLIEYSIKYDYPYEKKEWLDDMIKKFTSIDGCKMISHDKTINLIVFEYTDNSDIVKTIKYYYASPFPEILDVDNCHSVFNPSNKKKDAILDDITGYDVLHIAGYIPHSSILNYASEIIDISGSTGTVYELENYTEEEIKDDEYYQDNVIFYDKINQMIKSGRIRNWSYQKLNWNDETKDYDYIKTITRKATLYNIFIFIKTAVYIGAGECRIDFPANHIPEYDEFICIDKAPNDNSMNMVIPDVDTLKKSFIDDGWTLIREIVEYDLLVFTKIVKGKTKTIKYYHSTSFPFDEKKENDNKIKTIEMDIRGYNGLICHNYRPHSSIFKYSDEFNLFLSSMDYHDNIKEYVHSLIGEDDKYNLNNIVTMVYEDDETKFVFQKNIYENAFDFFSK